MVDATFPSLPALLAARAEREPDRPFVSDLTEQDVTYGELHERALRWADALRSHGVDHGDTVLTMAPNSVESMALWLGLSWQGAIEVPVNLELRGNVLEHVMEASQAHTMVVHPDQARLVADALRNSASVGSLLVWGETEPDLQLPDVDVRATADVIADATPRVGRAPADHDIACVLFTSGTTGPSKGVLVPWANLHASALGSLPADDLGSDDVWYGPGSASHVGAKSMPFLFAMLDGRVVLRERFSTTQFWSDVERFGVTSTVLVGSVAHYLHRLPDDRCPGETTLRNVLMVPVMADHAAFNERFGTRICTVFNMTEISVPIVSDGWSIQDWRAAGRLRAGYPGYEVRLVDEHDHEVPDGTVGEMIVRTSTPWALNAGYLGMPQATAAAWRNGWFHTGDLFRRSPDGWYYFVDRAKDALRVRGENVSSAEVEAEVQAHPDVLECAAVAVPAQYAEDEIKVCVVPVAGARLDPEDLVEFLIPRAPRYMVPRYVEVLSELPKNWRLRVLKEPLRASGVSDDTWDRVVAGVEIPRT